MAIHPDYYISLCVTEHDLAEPWPLDLGVLFFRRADGSMYVSGAHPFAAQTLANAGARPGRVARAYRVLSAALATGAWTADAIRDLPWSAAREVIAAFE